MTSPQTLLQLATRCRRLARLCSTVMVARKFEALALDYEEHARLLGGGRRAANNLDESLQSKCIEPGSGATSMTNGL